jgi:hypothetical protein
MVLWRVVVGLAALVVVFLAYDLGRVALLRRWAKDVTVGMSTDEVEDRLGKPDCVFPKGGRGLLWSRPYEQWAFGTRCETTDAFPYVSPLHIRLWGPDSEDIVIEFDDSNRVRTVSIPQ